LTNGNNRIVIMLTALDREVAFRRKDPKARDPAITTSFRRTPASGLVPESAESELCVDERHLVKRFFTDFLRFANAFLLPVCSLSNTHGVHKKSHPLAERMARFGEFRFSLEC
jgi:hypothetical protein